MNLLVVVSEPLVLACWGLCLFALSATLKSRVARSSSGEAAHVKLEGLSTPLVRTAAS